MKTQKSKLFPLLAILSLVFGSLFTAFKTTTVKAAELNYSITSATLITNGTVAAGETMDLSYGWAVANDVAITSGDTITLTLPDTLSFPSTLTDQILTVNGSPVGTYTLNASTGKIIMTFNEAGEQYFATNPLDKGGEVGVKVVASRTVSANKEQTEITTGTFEGIALANYTFEGSGDGSVDGYAFKYGYVSSTDPTLINWFAVINARQDIIRSIVVSDTLGDGQTLEGVQRLVRLAYKEGGYKTEEEARAGSVVTNLTGQVVVDGNTWTFKNGDGHYGNVYGGGSTPEYSPTYVVQYTSRINDLSALKGTLSNSLTVQGLNMGPRTANKTVSYDYTSWAVAWGAKETAANIVATKALTGKDLVADQFEFELYEVANNGTETLKETVKNTADGSVTFSPITYTQAGVYTYKVVEKSGSEENVEYSTEELIYRVLVTKSGDQYLAQVGSPENGTVITNVYTAPVTTTTTTTGTTTTTAPTTTTGTTTTTAPTTTTGTTTTTAPTTTTGTAATTTGTTTTTAPTT
ncbi:Spy0128 family protein, partial [Streptococcus rifensis]